MKKLSRNLYKATRTLGKIASTVNTIEHLGKSVKTKDPSHFAKHVARKKANKGLYKGSSKGMRFINRLFR